MILEIDDLKTTGDLQDRFASCYPLLKLGFCKNKHGWEKTCPESQIMHDDIPLAHIRTKHEPGTIEIKSWSKVGEVEREFYTRFGLNVQICYRSGGKWIQTGKSDSATIDFLMKKSSSELSRVLL